MSVMKYHARCLPLIQKIPNFVLIYDPAMAESRGHQ